jgi:hypothetical protein
VNIYVLEQLATLAGPKSAFLDIEAEAQCFSWRVGRQTNKTTSLSEVLDISPDMCRTIAFASLLRVVANVVLYACYRSGRQQQAVCPADAKGTRRGGSTKDTRKSKVSTQRRNQRFRAPRARLLTSFKRAAWRDKTLGSWAMTCLVVE